MEQILDSTEVNNSEKVFNYAGFWIRFVASIIDTIIFVFFEIIVFFIAGYGFQGFILPHPMLTIFLQFAGIAYYVGMESSAKQATLGKILVGIKVGDANGDRISVGRALGRYLSKIISAIILCIGFIMAGFDKKKQALHDKIAGTYVMSN